MPKLVRLISDSKAEFVDDSHLFDRILSSFSSSHKVERASLELCTNVMHQTSSSAEHPIAEGRFGISLGICSCSRFVNLNELYKQQRFILSWACVLSLPVEVLELAPS